MPRAARRKKDDIDPDGIYVAWQAGSADIDGVSYTVTTGEHRRGSDPFVQAHPWLFVADGATEGEMPTAFTQLVERTNAERAAVDRDVIVVHKPEPLIAEDVRVLNRAITVAVGAGKDQELIQYERGTVFRAGCELCWELPDAFEEADPDVQFTRRRRR
jgi:hypothetical protein